MKCNVGKTDRIVRIVAGLAIGALGLAFNSWWGLVGVVLLLTGIFRFCGFYLPFNIDTTGKR